MANSPGLVASTKRCTRCALDLPLDAFRTLVNGSLRSMCRPCDRDYARQYAEDNKEARREYHYQHRFGMGIAEYEAMVAAQGGACAICGREERRARRGGGVKLLGVDHDHETGKVRGLLCHDCNVSIGLLNEDPDLFRAAIAYLESHKELT